MIVRCHIHEKKKIRRMRYKTTEKDGEDENEYL